MLLDRFNDDVVRTKNSDNMGIFDLYCMKEGT